MHWLEDRCVGAVRERRFDLVRDGRRVPGLLWSPPGPVTTTPIVLLGHGASGSKRTDYVSELARGFAARGIAAAAIDGPVHGDRRSDGGRDSRLVFLDFVQAWSSNPAMTDDMVADWIAVLDELLELDEFDPARIGWWGLSMGTIIGLPFVAAEARIGAAVLGLMGLTGPTQDRIRQDAPGVRCPVMFLMQWNDEIFGRESSAALFEAIGSPDKRLLAYPGRHGAVPQEALRSGESFLATRLAGAL